MIRHMLLFSFGREVRDAARTVLLEQLRGLPDLFPVIRGFELGPNLSSRDDTYEYGMTMTFDDVAAMEGYLTSEVHETFVATRFRPLVARRAIVSFETGKPEPRP